jgi:PAS domain S-box-containing protein
MFGYARNQLIGQDVETIVPERFRAAHHAKRQQYQAAPTTRTIAGELAAKRADGTEFPVEIRIGPLDTQRTRSIVGIVRDITERQRLQELQQRLVHDLGERVKELTALQLTGSLLNEPASPRELLCRLVRQLPDAWQYPAITDARITVGDIDVRTDGFKVTPWIQRADFQTSEGQQGTIEVVYRESRPAAAEGPFLAEERNLIRSLASMLQAYFERVHAERDRLNLARAEAARLQAEGDNAAKDQFLATLSHELRSPLNVMLGWTQNVAIWTYERGCDRSRIRGARTQREITDQAHRRSARRIADYHGQVEDRENESRSGGGDQCCRGRGSIERPHKGRRTIGPYRAGSIPGGRFSADSTGYC